MLWMKLTASHMRPGQRASAVDACSELVENRGAKKILGALRHRRRIADNAIAHDERLLGRFDQAVHVVKAFGLRNAQPLEQRQDHQRRQALRRRREIEQLRPLYADRKRPAPRSTMGGEIVDRDRRLAAREVGGDFARQLARVEIERPLLADAFEGARERRHLHHLAFARQLPVQQERRHEIRRVLQFGKLRRGELLLAQGDREAVLAGPHGVLDQARQRQPAAEFLADRKRLRPSGQGAGDRVGRERPALRDRRMTVRGVHLCGRGLRRPATGVHCQRPPSRGRDQPEAVAADGGHVRIDHRKACRHRNRRLDGVAALAQHAHTRLAGEMVRRCHHATAGTGSVQHWENRMRFRGRGIGINAAHPSKSLQPDCRSPAAGARTSATVRRRPAGS
jgi:hypothetical protein